MNDSYLHGEFRGAAERLRLIPQTLALVWKPAPGWCTAWAGLLLVQGFLPAVLVYLTRPLTNALVAAAQAGFAADVLREFIILATAYGLVVLTSELLGGALAGVRSVQAELVGDYVTDRIHVHAMETDLEFYESPEYHDQLIRAREQASSRPLALLENIGEVVQGGVSLLAIAAILLTYGPVISLLLLASALPAAFVLIKHQRLSHRWWLETTTERRRTGYYDAYLTSDWAAEEQRLFGWGPAYRQAYRELRKGLRDRYFGLVRRQAFAQAGAGVAALALAAAAAAWVVWSMSKGLTGLGDLALFYTAFNQGQSRLRVLLGGAANIFSNLLFVESLHLVLGLKPRVTSPAEPRKAPRRLSDGIRFRGVSFAYPGSQRPVLERLDLVIPAGKTVAVVGENGAGKTTLTKLLCRFYDPQEGSIEIDGVDIRDFSLIDLRRMMSVMFQLPVSYAESVEYNIRIGDLSADDYAHKAVQAATSAGAHEFIGDLPEGYQTNLGKMFPGGVNLSAGQSQRVALARAFFRDSPIVLLDEPTSFMDSWAEIEWLARFKHLVRGRTVVMITHRFTTAMRADLIYVMQNGLVAEVGSHAELVARGGLYATSWAAQASGDRLEPVR